MLTLASYKSTRPGLPGLYNRVVRFWEPGRYSHTELIFSDGIAGSASLEDGGVRLKHIQFAHDRWDFVPLPSALEAAARTWFETRQGMRYDILGQFRFVLAPSPTDKKGFWCSEAVAASLGLIDPWRYGPNLLHAVVSSRLVTPTESCVAQPIN